MPSPAELALLLLAAAAPVQDAPPAGAGPRASSNEGQRYDAVGYAAVSEGARGAAHPTLPAGSYVEVTALDTGKTALFEIVATTALAAGESIALSPDAMRQLAITAPGAPVRVRAANPTPPEIAALRNGETASGRLDAPDVLLVGLRKRLPPRGAGPRPAPTQPVAAARPAASAERGAPIPVPAPGATAPRPAPVTPRPAPAAAARPLRNGWGVQVAALSDAGRARALASQLGGQARAAGRMWRVQLGPYPDQAAAERARAAVARRGHPGAALVRIP